MKSYSRWLLSGALRIGIFVILSTYSSLGQTGKMLVSDGDLDLASYVNTFIGTDNGAPDYGLGNAAGDTPPGAAYPFGMVLWSPDTTNAAGGYRYFHDAIKGFSLTHFSGRGVS